MQPSQLSHQIFPTKFPFVFLIAIAFLFTPNKGTAEATNATVQDFAIGPPPAWVKPIVSASLEDKSVPASDTEGEHFLLLDYQSNVGTHEDYTHIVKKIVNQNGVQNGTSLQFHFDPAYEKLTVHFIRIIRDGRTIEKLEPQKFKVIQQESGLERHLFDGSLKAVLFLEDVRVGDVVEFAYTRKGSNPIFKDHYLNDYAVEWAVPVLQEYLRVVCPVEKQLFVKNHKTSLLPTITESNGVREYVWQARDVPAVILEDSTPDWFEASGWVQLTDFPSWREVVEWARPLYEANNPPLPEDLRQKISTWRQAQTPEERAGLALRFVQDEVRYLGIEVGRNSHQPNDPALVFSRRFGDCKDKALLFCTILKEMDIEAHPVLVNSYNRSRVSSWAPSPYAFNHVVTQVKLNGKWLWLDPTLSSQRGPLTNLYFPDYGRGLVIAAGSADLIVIPMQQTGLPLIAIDETFRIPNYSNDVSFNTTTVRYGHDADRMRAELTGTRREELQKSYLNHYAKFYRKIRVDAPMEIRDDEDRNVLTIREHYSISDFWELSDDKENWMCDFVPEDIDDLAAKPDVSFRSMPLEIPYPLRRRQITHVLLPENSSFENEFTNIFDGAMRLTKKVTYAQRQLTIQYDFETLTNAVATADMPAHLEILKRIRDASGYSIQRPNERLENRSASQPNWPILLLAIGYFIVLVVGAALVVWLYPQRQAGDVPPIINPTLTGIGGWLIILALILVSKPFLVIQAIVQNANVYSINRWAVLTTPGGSAYHPLWAPLLLFELLTNLTLLVFSVLVLIFLFKKRCAFPRFAIAYLVFSSSVLVFDHIATGWVRPSRLNPKATSEMFGACLGACLWIMYLVNSKRVKLTFVR